jgi:hypothetical protein
MTIRFLDIIYRRRLRIRIGAATRHAHSRRELSGMKAPTSAIKVTGLRTRLWRLCGGLCPGLLDFHDFLG